MEDYGHALVLENMLWSLVSLGTGVRSHSSLPAYFFLEYAYSTFDMYLDLRIFKGRRRTARLPEPVLKIQILLIWHFKT